MAWRSARVGTVLLLAAATCLASVALPAEKVAPNIELITGKTAAGSQPDGNSVLIDAPDGLIVFDTGRHAEHTRQVLDAARQSGKPIRAIINSHWHLDHVGGNVLVRAAYPSADVYATSAIDAALDGFLANYRKQLADVLARPDLDPRMAESSRAEIALINAGAQLKPTRVVEKSSHMTIAGRALELYVERAAVTAGDIWLFDPRTRVLIAGDLVTLPAPFFDTACPGRWQTALATLSRKPFSQLIPGHGAVMDRAQFDTYRVAFDNLVGCGNDTAKAPDTCVDAWVRDAASLIPENDRAYARALVNYYVDATFRGDAARQASACRMR